MTVKETKGAKYARDQPAGFTNRIQNVAVVGAGGTIGSFLANALLATGKHNVTAITRAGSTSKLPKGVKVAEIDYDNEDTIVSALKGQQFLAIAMNPSAPQDTQKKLIKAAAKAGVPWVLPNSYVPDIFNESLCEEIISGYRVRQGIKDVEEAGPSWIAMFCSYWYEFSLAQGQPWYGFDIKNRKVTFYDDGETRINTSTWYLCGKSLAALLSLKELPEDEEDESPTISQWRDKPLWISSFLVSQKDMYESLKRVTGTTDKDWEIEYEGSKARWQRGKDLINKGDFEQGFYLCLYARGFYPNGDGNYQDRVENKILGLPEEDLDEATKRAVDMAEGGFDYLETRFA